MSGISAFYILDHKGRVLITRAFRADISPNIPDVFNKKMLEYDEYTIKPILMDKEGHTFFYVRHNNLILVAVTKRNSNSLLVFSFINKFIEVLVEYFKEVEEESIRDNFVIVYELLDEMMVKSLHY